MQTILVTGATGRVGRRFVPRLLQQDYRVRLLLRQPAQAASFQQLGTEVVIGDLSQPETLPAALAGVNTVVHLAAFFRGADQDLIQTTNESGTMTLARAAVEAGVQRFVFSSTNLVYGPGVNRASREEDLPQPVFAYPRTKVAAEQALLALQQTHGLDVRILRLAFVYGEEDPHIEEFLPRLAEWHPARRLHMVHHADVSQALLRAIAVPSLEGHIFNVADDAPISIAELFRMHGQEDILNFEASPTFNPWDMVVDTMRIREELDFRPIYPSFYTARAAGVL